MINWGVLPIAKALVPDHGCDAPGQGFHYPGCSSDQAWSEPCHVLMSQDRSAIGILGMSSLPYSCLGEIPRWQNSRRQVRTRAHSNLLSLDEKSIAQPPKNFGHLQRPAGPLCIAGGNLQIQIVIVRKLFDRQKDGWYAKMKQKRRTLFLSDD